MSDLKTIEELSNLIYIGEIKPPNSINVQFIGDKNIEFHTNLFHYLVGLFTKGLKLKTQDPMNVKIEEFINIRDCIRAIGFDTFYQEMNGNEIDSLLSIPENKNRIKPFNERGFYVDLLETKKQYRISFNVYVH